MGRWDIASNLPIATPIICVDFDFKVARRFSRRDFGGDFVFIFADGFFNSGEQGFSRVIEADQVPVFGEEFADRDFIR